jgi:hypothetical protein
MATDNHFQAIPNSEYQRWRNQLLRYSHDDVSNHVKKSMPSPPPAGFGSHLETVHFACTAYAVNIYDAALLLLQSDYWEEAMTLTRSLYELLLNLDEVHCSDDKQTEKQAEKYLGFGLLQRYLSSRTGLVRGVYPGDDATVSEALFRSCDAHCESVFGAFRRSRLPASRPWHKTWADSWCGKNMRELADGSADYRLKESYDSFYFLSSCLAHATPHSVLSVVGVSPLFSDLDPARREEEVRKDRQRGWLNAWFCGTFFFIDIIEYTKDILMSFDRNWLDKQRKAIHTRRLQFHPPFPHV